MTGDESVAGEQDLFTAISEEQRTYFSEHKLTESLGAAEFLLGSIAVACVKESNLHRAFPAKVRICHKTDTLKVTIDSPTIDELIEELVMDDGMTREDVLRLYVGVGLSNLLLAGRLPTRPAAVAKFLGAMTEPSGLYNRTMDSALFDVPSRLQTIEALVINGTDEEIARVNGLRLAVGTYIEAQPKPAEVRTRLEGSFQHQLEAIFDGKGNYLKTVSLFGVENTEAETMYADNATTTLAVSFPMSKKEVASLIKMYR